LLRALTLRARTLATGQRSRGHYPGVAGGSRYRRGVIRSGRDRKRSWEVLLIGGASGTGKTSVAFRLAHHFAVGITAIDDFQVILERMTTPEQQPALHFWRTHPDPGTLTAEEIVRQGLEVARAMTPALETVIADHLDAKVPIVLEGDFIAPMLAAQPSFDGQPNAGRVRAVFLYEPDETQILRNLSHREPEAGIQAKRARVSWLQGQPLQRECERLGIPALPARPWRTLFTRVLEAVT
jgi:2-phosphoglycerate kinase